MPIDNDGSNLLPTFAMLSEKSLGWYRSAGSTMALSYGTLSVPGVIVSGSTVIATGRLEAQITGGEVARFRSDRVSSAGRNWGIFINGVVEGDFLIAPSTTNTGDPATGNVVLGLSVGSISLNQNRLLSVRTLAASALTASAANTNVAVNEAVFTIQASGASFVINSGGTTWIFNSSASAKNT